MILADVLIAYQKSLELTNSQIARQIGITDQLYVDLTIGRMPSVKTWLLIQEWLLRRER